MILLFIFILGCFVMSIVAVGLLFALASVGYGDVYESPDSSSVTEPQELPRRILRPDPAHSESQQRIDL